ncbi:MAG: ribokinase [Actinomycetaceae bacterium]
MTGGNVVVVGSVNADLVLSMDTLPQPGETLAATGIENLIGGKGANQATAAARLGASVQFVGRTGLDEPGERARRTLAAAGVGIDHVTAESSVPTGQAIVMVDGSGENSIVVVGGANAAMTAADVERAAEVIAAADVVVCQLEVPQAVVAAAFAAARGTTILNAAPAAAVSTEILARTDVLVVNEIEYGMLGGDATFGADSADLPATVVLTLGGAGARVLARGADPVDVSAPRVEVVDTTGAGDTFVGALAEALARGESTEASVRRAVAAGAASVGALGATAGMPTVDQVDALLEG